MLYYEDMRNKLINNYSLATYDIVLEMPSELVCSRLEDILQLCQSLEACPQVNNF